MFAVSAWLSAAVCASAHQTDKELLARGEYLVERVAMCGDCHTPRSSGGEPDQARPLQGATLRFGPSDRAGFAQCAPAIAGMHFWTKAQAVRFLETGLMPSGTYAKPPMPRYRLSRDDADAVVAYLRSLRPASSEPCAAPANGAAE
jgi:mono/diheme cytochrome c family protein